MVFTKLPVGRERFTSETRLPALARLSRCLCWPSFSDAAGCQSSERRTHKHGKRLRDCYGASHQAIGVWRRALAQTVVKRHAVQPNVTETLSRSERLHARNTR